MTLKSNPDVGEDVEAHCRKCKANTVHTVIAIGKRSVKRVLCKACQAQHNYSKPKDPEELAAKKSAQKKTTTRTSTRRSSQNIGEMWTALVSSLESSEVVDYTMKGDYKENSLIKHPIFGVGVVTKRINSSRAEVLFEKGIKLMATSRK